MVYCYLANGFEEIEALAPVDLLRRAGVEVKTVGVGGSVITSSHGIPVTCDLTEDFAAAHGSFICAICAAPSVLGHKGLLDGKEAIAFPGFEKDLIGATVSEKYVVTDGNIITARGAGVAVDFGLAIVAVLKDRATAEKIRAAIQCRN